MLRRLGQAIGRWLTPQNAITTPVELEKALDRYMSRSASGVSVTQASVSGLPTAHRCIRVLSETTSQLPLKVMLTRDGGRVPAPDMPAARVLANPNPWQKPYEFRELMTDDALKTGNASALITRGVGGAPVQLIRMHPAHYRIMPTDRGVPEWVWRNPQTGEETVYPHDRVLHLRGPSDDGYTGLSPVQVFRNSLGESQAMQEHAGRFWANSAMMGLVVTPSEGVDMSPESRKALREDLDEMQSGANAFKTAVLPAGMTMDTVSMNHRDAQFIDGRKMSRIEICQIYGVPPHLAYDLERATYSNIVEQSMEFLKYGVGPWLIRWEQAILFSLVPERDRAQVQIKHNVDALLRGDPKARAESLNIQRRAGVINANEWRALNDMDPRTDEGGDRYIIESNMQSDSGRLMNDLPEGTQT